MSMRGILSWVMIAIFLGVLGCDNNQSSGDTDGGGTGTEPESCGAITPKAVASGNAGAGRYLWLGLLKDDSLLLHGDSVFVAGIYSNVPLSLEISYLDSVPSDEYDLRIFSSELASDVGNHRNRLSAAEAGKVLIPTLTAGVNATCCTAFPPPLFRGYSGFGQNNEQLTGVSAKITARYGKPCGYPDSSADAFGVAYVNLGWEDGWGQAGVGYMRGSLFAIFPGKTIKFVYYELLGSNRHVYQYYVDDSIDQRTDNIWAPHDGDVGTYEVSIDTITAHWSFKLNDEVDSYSTPDPLWNTSGTKAIWTGETYNVEDDMPGTDQDRSTFSDMKIRIGNGGYDPVSYNLLSDWEFVTDANAFGFYRGQSDRVEIWDKDPQP